MLKNLKTRLEGKTVLAVDSGKHPQAICKITLSDDSAFRLCSTDLGFWTEETVDKWGNYRSLNALFNEYEDHKFKLECQGCVKVPDPKISIKKGIIRVKAMDGKTFKAHTGFFSKWERKVCAHPKAQLLLAKACGLGEMWDSVFQVKNKECPSELYLSERLKKELDLC